MSRVGSKSADGGEPTGGPALVSPTDDTSRKPWIFRHHVATRNAFEALNAEPHLPLVFRPTGREAPAVDIRGARTPMLAVWTVNTTTGFESTPAGGLDLYSIRIPLRGGLIRRTGGDDHEMRVGDGTILPADEIRASRFLPDTEVLSCSIASSQIHERHAVLDGTDAPLRLRTHAKIEGPRLRALVDTIGRIAAHVGTEADVLTGPLLFDLLVNQVLSVWPRDMAALPAGSDHVVARAIEYIEAHLGGSLTVGEVAAAAGVSVRTLQMAFRTRMGRTPLAYILDRRLERAHADLAANEGRLQVSQIAYRWGFLHMGEFARRYRLRYGCSPSQTGRRAD